jgi:hypothetical protein
MTDLVQPLFFEVTDPAVRTELKKGLEHGYGFLDRAIDQLGSEITVLEVSSNTRGPDDSELRTRIDLSEAESLLGAITQYVRAILVRGELPLPTRRLAPPP